MDFKFDKHVPRHSPDMTLKHFAKRGCDQGHVTPNFGVLNANSSKTVKATDFNFGKHVPRDPLKFLFCKNSLGGDMHSHKRILVTTCNF